MFLTNTLASKNNLNLLAIARCFILSINFEIILCNYFLPPPKQHKMTTSTENPVRMTLRFLKLILENLIFLICCLLSHEYGVPFCMFIKFYYFLHIGLELFLLNFLLSAFIVWCYFKCFSEKHFLFLGDL